MCGLLQSTADLRSALMDARSPFPRSVWDAPGLDEKTGVLEVARDLEEWILFGWYWSLVCPRQP